MHFHPDRCRCRLFGAVTLARLLNYSKLYNTIIKLTIWEKAIDSERHHQDPKGIHSGSRSAVDTHSRGNGVFWLRKLLPRVLRIIFQRAHNRMGCLQITLRKHRFGGMMRNRWTCRHATTMEICTAFCPIVWMLPLSGQAIPG